MAKKKYIRIRNTSGQDEMLVPRIALEKLGLSTKREDMDTIGRFGSGIKFAPIAALRNGWEWVFVGNDRNGSYHMKYIVQQEDGVDCIWYDYGDHQKPSSFTTGAGELSWTDAFQIIREPVANAMDGVSQFGGEWSIDVVNKIETETDKFSFDVYITAAPELVQILENIDLYFSFNRKRVFEALSYEAYGLKKVTSDFRVFSQNVLVYHKPDERSLFDYEFSVIDLNEERTIKSEWDLGSKIAYILTKVSDSDVVAKVIKEATSMMDTEPYEFGQGCVSHYKNNNYNDAWKQMFYTIYGDNAVIYPVDKAASSIEASLKLRGAKAIPIYSDGAYKFLEAAGVENYMTTLGEDYQYEIQDDISKYPELIDAIGYVKRAIPDSASVIDNCGILLGEAARQCKGLAINIKDPLKTRILVSVHHLDDSSISDIVSTLVHEYDHATSGIGDGYSEDGRRFRDLADKHIGKMIVKNYKPNPFFLNEDGVLSMHGSSSALVGGLRCRFEYVKMLDAYIIVVGSTTIKATGCNIVEQSAYVKDEQRAMPIVSDDGEVIEFPFIKNIERIEIV